MSGYKRVSFYELCRLCASNTQKEKTHIFQEEGRKIQLQNKIQVCLALTVNENDFLPKVVCSKCLLSLETCFGFRQECVRSESMLSTYFKNFRYTEDFKKSGKVYIKDIKSSINIPNVEATAIGGPAVTQSLSQNILVNKNQQSVEQVPFYTLQLPTIVANPNIVNKPQKTADTSKLSQNQFAYNLNLINTANIKTGAAKTDIVSNVVVNSNGEVINIAHMGDFETILNQGNALKSKTKSLKHKEISSQQDVVQIDLTESDNSEFDLDSTSNKFDKSPNIKTTQNHNKFTYSVKVEEKPQTQTVIFPVAEYDLDNTSSKFDKPSHIKSTQNHNKFTYSVKVEEKPQNQTVIFPISEYNQNFNNFASNSVYTQSLNLVNTNPTNVITNTATTVETSALNVINQNLQEINQPGYTNVISGSNGSEMCKQESDQNISSNSVGSSNGSQQKTHICEVCQRAFKRREHLYQHVKLHTGFRPYICEHCNKAFMRKEHLLRHSTLHSGQKNFTCHICEKSFSRNDNLIKHRKTHDKQTSYTCEFCHKQFVMKHYYNAHKLTHDKFVSTVWGLLKT